LGSVVVESTPEFASSVAELGKDPSALSPLTHKTTSQAGSKQLEVWISSKQPPVTGS
jgi:hypothetical protein